MASLVIILPEILDISILRITYEPHFMGISMASIAYSRSGLYDRSTQDAEVRNLL
jgi:hypothetical protein